MPPPLPYRGTFGAARPSGLPTLPPAAMPSHLGINPLKTWRWVGVFSEELMLVAARVRVGPARQSFFAIYDRTTPSAPVLLERTGAHLNVEMATGHLRITEPAAQLDLQFAESAGIEIVTGHENGYAWTRKQAPLPAHGVLMLNGAPREIHGRALIDDSSGYLPRHTQWRWCAGVGESTTGQQLAWNLVEGVHDSPTNSERTLWVDGEPRELPPTAIAGDLSAAGDLSFHPELTRTIHENRIVVRSHYVQPFGTFSGSIDGVQIARGYGVMEDHDAHW